MLGATSAENAAQLKQSVFTDYVAPADLDRFAHFMESTQTWSANDSMIERPSASIQVHMRDLHGITFPVELFHANIPMVDTDQAGHIFGIKDSNPLARQERVESSRGLTSSADE